MQGILWLGWLQGSDSFRTPWGGNELFEIENAGGCNHFFPGMLWDFLGWFGMGKHIPILLFPPEGSLLITHCLGEKHLDLVKQGLWEFLASMGVEIQVRSSGREYIPSFSLQQVALPRKLLLQGFTPVLCSPDSHLPGFISQSGNAPSGNSPAEFGKHKSSWPWDPAWSWEKDLESDRS